MKDRAILIVESPTKAKTISNILKGKMKVLSTKGHIKDLPKTKLGVDIENNFEPTYILIKGKGKIVREIKSEAKKVERVYLGCDPDREGEAIAFHIAEEINNNKEMKRVLFYEITKNGIERALQVPEEIDLPKVNSHKARRVLDRLVGYLVSPILWQVFKNRNLSAGRVQTVALRFIVEREEEIENFIPEKYWVISAIFAKENGEEFKVFLEHRKEGERIKDKSLAEELVKKIKEMKEAQIDRIKREIKYKSPPPPFITASLQQEAARKLFLSSKKTMFLAQRLFEGVELKEEIVGLITYPRTDSKRVAEEFLEKERDFIQKEFGEKYLPEKIRSYRDRKETQGAHEAIRPTDLMKRPELIKDYLDKDSYKLYDLIFRRAVASQMADAQYEEKRIEIFVSHLIDFLFSAYARRRIFDGFEKVFPSEEKEVILPELKEGEKVRLVDVFAEEKLTQPPPRYTEASLIKKLEVNGIGRPSTYAGIISTLLERRYVEKRDGKLHPTELGRLTEEILVNNFSDIFEVHFTRRMEEELDLIEEKRKEWQEVVRDFYLPFVKDLKKSEENLPKIKEGLKEEISEKCPICGRNLIYKWGRFGKFISCSGYPECKFIKKEEKELLAEKCPDCGSPLVRRRSKRGEEFIACSAYPKCKFVKKEKKVLEEKCPECGANLVERKSRFGNFIACGNYPKCKFRKKR
ncbi:MAG: type I DNA topoisomerase [candidate division WOR-3 bacterium]